MKQHIYILIFIITLPCLAQASEDRGLRIATITDQTGQEIGLYQESHALIIGVSDYTEGWPDLPGVAKDIQAVQAALEGQGFDVVAVNNPNRTQLEEAFTGFITQYGQQADNRLLFYFAGHGHTMTLAYGGEMGYIVPADAPNPYQNEAGFLSKALDMQQIEVYAKRIQAKHALFLFDSCFSGSIFALSRAVPESISYKTAQPVRQFMTSGSAEEQVPDESVFRQQFVAALQGEGDLNGDGYVTGAELGEFLQSSVVNYSKGAQHPQYGKIRDPHLDKGDFVFLLPGAVQVENLQITVETGHPVDAEAEMWALVKDSTDPKDLKTFLDAFPDGKLAKVAQLKLDQLARQQPTLTFEFFSDSERGLTDFDDYAEQQGGVLEVIDDPTDSGRGKVFQGKITKKLGKDEEYQIYPEKNFPFQECPCRIQQDSWMSKQIYDDIQRHEEGWLAILDIFDNADWDSGNDHQAASVSLWNDRYLHLDIIGEEGAEDEYFSPDNLPNAPQFTPEIWHIIAVEIDAEGLVSLYQDEQLVTRGKLRPPSRYGLAYVHGGPLVGPSYLKKGGYVLADNLRIACYSR